MHELERQALDDPFLADAIEGYSQTNKPATKQLSILQTQLSERIAQQQALKNTLGFSWQRLSIAAAAGLLFITASILFYMRTQQQGDQIAMQPKEVEVSLTPADSMVENSSAAVPESAPEVAAEPRKKAVVRGTAAAEERETEAAKSQLKQVVVLKKEARAADPQPTFYGARKLEEKTAVVSSLSIAEDERAKITGKVLSADGEPLIGVSVRISGSNTGVSTNLNGEFQLQDSTERTLRLSYLGFKEKEVKASPGDPVIVSLEESSHSLNEVVTVGYGSKKKSLKEAQPVSGWKNYETYLRSNIRQSEGITKGKVVVSFSVNSSNQLQNFKIEKGLTQESNAEAIRLIKEGPAWQHGKDSVIKVTVPFK